VEPADASFKVFDFSKTQRQSYYHPAPATPEVGLVSRTGMDVEAQILDGGGIANMREGVAI